jgi:hypothetical protein
MSTRLLKSALAMCLIKRKTTVTVPEVYEFNDLCNNQLCCASVLMEHIEGHPLCDVWFHQSVAPVVFEQQQFWTLRDVTESVIKLNKFTFSRGSTIPFDENCSPSGDIELFKTVDITPMFDHLREGHIFDVCNVFSELSLFTDPKSYFTSRLGN